MCKVGKQIRLLQKVESTTFSTSVHVVLSTSLRQTCFAASDVYGVTPVKFYPIRSQYSPNLQQPLVAARQV